MLDVSGPAERTGKQRGTDLLDGTVTLPLILAREQDPELGELDLRALSAREQAEAVCDRIAATGALERRARERASWSREAKAALDGDVDAALREPLDDVADRIVDATRNRNGTAGPIGPAVAGG